MITYADVEKLLATRSEDSPVLSLYLEVPLDLPALRGLPVRAGELVNSAAGGPCGPGGPHAERALTEARHVWGSLDPRGQCTRLAGPLRCDLHLRSSRPG